ncbi:MAG: DUF554 domain-containing protein [Chloroflexi bacterium]|nr:DUF554 domain-containing protein [Chloroflexota bacterium]
MTGTLINVAAVLAGTTAGLLLGARLPERVRETALQALGLATLLIGVQMALRTENVLVALGSLALGGAAGAWLGIDDGLERFGRWIEKRLTPRSLGSAEQSVELLSAGRGKISQAFVTSSLLFCVGPMTILGSIQDGLTGDYSTLAVKAMLDGIASIAFASALGIGVILSTGTILVYQGSLTLGATWLRDILTEPMTREMSAAGGLLIVGIGLRLLNIRQLQVGNLLPAIVIAPIIVRLVG